MATATQPPCFALPPNLKHLPANNLVGHVVGHGRRTGAMKGCLMSLQKQNKSHSGSMIQGSALLKWSDGKPVGSLSSVATLAASMLSIPVLGAMLGAPDSPSFITEITQLSAALLILQAGIPSFRSKLVLLATTAACLLDILCSGIVVGSTSPALIASLLLSSSVFLAMKDGGGGVRGAEEEVSLISTGEEPAIVAAGSEEMGSESFELKSWERNFGIEMRRGENPREWSVEEFCSALRDAGLEESIPAVRRAKIDGMVAMTLTVKDEDSLKQELGLPLALRRRLLFFVESLREEEERRESAGEGRVEE